MSVATVTSKGQITIPAGIREEFGINAGDRIEFVSIGDGTIHLRLMSATAETFFASLAGFERTNFAGTDDQALAAALSEEGAELSSKRRRKAA